MRYKVPQKIDLEDRIFGPLTMKQFGYVFGGGVIDYILFNTLYGLYGLTVFIIAAFVPTVIAFALAFIKVQDRPFGEFIISFLLFSLKPKVLIWGRTPDPAMKINKAPKKDHKIVPHKKIVRSDLDALATIVDARGWSQTEIQGTDVSGQNLSGRVITGK